MSENLRLADLTFPSGDAEIRAFGARPRGKGPFPGLVVVPDVRGLYEHFRDVAERYAAEGFLTLVVDLYSREGAPELADMDAIFQWMHDLPDRRVLADLAAAVAFLESNPLVRDGSVAIAGYCMGGKYALMAAATVPGLAAAVSWYGMLDEP
jgi:carboxymethylenebutenolidase